MNDGIIILRILLLMSLSGNVINHRVIAFGVTSIGSTLAWYNLIILVLWSLVINTFSLLIQLNFCAVYF